jgi:HlyD family secretion protein
VAGRIIELNAEEGGRVEEGALLVRIDDSLYAAQLRQAQAAVRTAASQDHVIDANTEGVDINVNRTKRLLDVGSATQMQLDNLNTARSTLDAQRQVVGSQVNQARAVVHLAQTQLGYTRIVSPLSGVVLRRHVLAGETIFPGSALLTIADLSVLEVKIYVPGPLLGKIKIGQQVELFTDSFPNRPFLGAISRISDQAEFTPKNVQTRDERIRLVYAVTVRVPNPDGVLKIGMPVDARFVAAR